MLRHVSSVLTFVFVVAVGAAFLAGLSKVGTLTSTTAVFTKDGIDKSSASAETFNIQNSGAGAMDLQLDGSSVLPATALCQLANTDGLLCTFDNTDGTPDIRAATNDILEVRTSGTGSVFFATDFIGIGEDTAGSAARAIWIGDANGWALGHLSKDTVIVGKGLNLGTFIGDRNNRGPTVPIGGVAESISLGPSYTSSNLLVVYGAGLVSSPQVQTGTCSAAAVTVDPQSATINIVTGGATCVVTVSSTSATSIAEDLDVLFVIADDPGAVHKVTFAGTPLLTTTLCSTTGLTKQGATLRVHWSQVIGKFTPRKRVPISCEHETRRAAAPSSVRDGNVAHRGRDR